MRLIFVWKLAIGLAILAVLAPAELAIRNCFRADVLKCPQHRIAFRHQERFAHNRNFDEFLERPKNSGHYRNSAVRVCHVDESPVRLRLIYGLRYGLPTMLAT